MPDLKENFCPSPWFHMRINHNGNFQFCRWAPSHKSNHNIHTTKIKDFFQIHMADVRQNMLSGVRQPECSECHHSEQHGKISGRQWQLLKIGVDLENWTASMKSSPWFDRFCQGQTTINDLPVDWQIDLGNECNSACIFCQPAFSSRLADEWLKLGLTNTVPMPNWATGDDKTQELVEIICANNRPQFLHFLGGETLITKSFKTLLEQIVAKDAADKIQIGFTTNLTVWRDDIIQLLTKFQSVHVGMSIECFDSLNDYLRWPSRIKSVTAVAEQWAAEAVSRGWYMSLRTTPTVLSMHRLLTVYDWAWQHRIPVESCNFLEWPRHLQPNVMPKQYRKLILDQIDDWIIAHNGTHNHQNVVNTRHPREVEQAIVQDLTSYQQYLRHEPDRSDQLPALIDFLKIIERHRNNSILDYLPEYESLLRSNGY